MIPFVFFYYKVQIKIFNSLKDIKFTDVIHHSKEYCIFDA
jgi:hypothetical protein